MGQKGQSVGVGQAGKGIEGAQKVHKGMGARVESGIMQESWEGTQHNTGIEEYSRRNHGRSWEEGRRR